MCILPANISQSLNRHKTNSNLLHVLLLYYQWRTSLKKSHNFVNCSVRRNFIHFVKHSLQQILNYLDPFCKFSQRYALQSFLLGHWLKKQQRIWSLQTERCIYLHRERGSATWSEVVTWAKCTVLYCRCNVKPSVNWRTKCCLLVTALPTHMLKPGIKGAEEIWCLLLK